MTSMAKSFLVVLMTVPALFDEYPKVAESNVVPGQAHPSFDVLAVSGLRSKVIVQVEGMLVPFSLLRAAVRRASNHH